MKKIIFLLVIFSLIFATAGAVNVSAKTNFSAGMLIKGKNNPTVYYFAEDGKRYVFPNGKTYFSWFDDFSGVVEIEDDELPQHPLGGNVRYKPGALLVKIQTDPKVYAVGNNGLLHWIKTEALAKSLYGENWSLLVDDVPDSFFTNYKVSDPIEDEDEYNPEDEEEETDSISCNLGLKTKKQIIKQTQTMNQRFCGNVKNAINRIQKRLHRWGVNMDIGNDYIDQCIEEDDSDGDDSDTGSSGKKITICHIPGGNPDAAHTISIGKAALKAHLKHGDYIGSCEGDDDGDEEDDVTAPVISNVASSVTHNSATITWTTDEDSDSEVEYALESISSTTPTTTVSDSATTTFHSIVIDGLTPETTYYYIVKSTDTSSNQATSTEMNFTTTQELDTNAPVISGISSTVATTTATISWTTDEASKGKVTYATESLATATSSIEVILSDFLTSQSADLTDLASSTQYFFRIEAEDESANVATSSEENFTTL